MNKGMKSQDASPQVIFIVTSHIKYSLPEVGSGYCCI